MVAIRIGDTIRIGTMPDVDPKLWDARAVVAALGPDDRLTVELVTGADVQVRIEHIASVTRPSMHDPFMSFFDR